MEKQLITVVSAAIRRKGRYLITQRKEQAVLPLLWEFPGGKVEPDENDVTALRRELKWRLGIEPQVGERLATTQQEYHNYIVDLRLYRCELGPIEPRPINVHDLKWVKASDFDNYNFTPADERSMDALLFGSEPKTE